MNNAKIAIDNVNLDLEEEAIDHKPALRSREGDLVRVIEALGRLGESDDWKLLKKLVFDGVTDGLERRLQSEAHKKVRDDGEIDRLNGQLAWAQKFSDISKLNDIFKVELKNVRTQIKNG